MFERVARTFDRRYKTNNIKRNKKKHLFHGMQFRSFHFGNPAISEPLCRCRFNSIIGVIAGAAATPKGIRSL
jgi:hypothetical protein